LNKISHLFICLETVVHTLTEFSAGTIFFRNQYYYHSQKYIKTIKVLPILQDDKEKRKKLKQKEKKVSLSHINKSQQPHSAIVGDDIKTYDQLHQHLRYTDLENSQLIIGVEFTGSNYHSGARTFDSKCLHHIEATTNSIPSVHFDESISASNSHSSTNVGIV